MTDRDLKLPIGRWLLWGLVAVLALIVIVALVAGLGRSTTEEAAPPDVEQVEWSIIASTYTPNPGEVLLKGDEPVGLPTETWLRGVMLARTVGGVGFTWNMDAAPPVPVPVYDIDQAEGCEELAGHLELWAEETAQAPGEARRAEASAFAQHAVDTMMAEGCTIPEV